MLKKLAAAFFAAAMFANPVLAAESAAGQNARPAAGAMKYLLDNTPLTPTKVFDNVYCIGSVSVVAWVLQTE